MVFAKNVNRAIAYNGLAMHRFNAVLAVVTLRFLVAGKKIAKKIHK